MEKMEEKIEERYHYFYRYYSGRRSFAFPFCINYKAG
jgi:hypothetical protein